MGDDEVDFNLEDEVDDEDEGLSSDEGAAGPARRASRIDLEMAVLIKERDKLLGTQDSLAKKRISRVTQPFQYADHDDRLFDGCRSGQSSRSNPSRSRDRGRRQRFVQTFPPVYDENGIHINSGRDLCDCLDIQCPGCHDDCGACGSPKCGVACRAGRTWTYQEVIQFHPHKPKEICRSRPV